ncbi:ribonuclease III [Corynebacterium choanae]|uniref:Ribonuclease 3 n=1 Tax=Corynebacterium choanae TaxID=1862358 RepID=A0A3G6JAG9_9CORY|nr:ribonuclease III [Corynebacterium choanae]AZA13908.1 Ribonuclease 3 [Corynebacterium choanae]
MSRKRNRLTGPAAWEQAFHAVDHQPLLDALGVELPEDLLKLALTHRSFANENGNLPNNERLEFLGDAILGVTIAEALFNRYADRAESDISKMRASIVSRYGLADIAREIHLGQHILLGRGEQQTGGVAKDSILADTTEALLGAIFHLYGFEKARAVILELFAAKIADASALSRVADFKTSLQERIAHFRFAHPAYTWSSEGPDHERVFTATVTIYGVPMGTGNGPNKKTAEQNAAHEALKALDQPKTREQLVLARQQLAANPQ